MVTEAFAQRVPVLSTIAPLRLVRKSRGEVTIFTLAFERERDYEGRGSAKDSSREVLLRDDGVTKGPRLIIGLYRR